MALAAIDIASIKRNAPRPPRESPFTDRMGPISAEARADLDQFFDEIVHRDLPGYLHHLGERLESGLAWPAYLQTVGLLASAAVEAIPYDTDTTISREIDKAAAKILRHVRWEMAELNCESLASYDKLPLLFERAIEKVSELATAMQVRESAPHPAIRVLAHSAFCSVFEQIEFYALLAPPGKAEVTSALWRKLDVVREADRACDRQLHPTLR